MIWNEEAECMSAEDTKKLQLQRLQKIVKRAYENVPYYRKRFDELNIKPEDIKTLKTLKNSHLRQKPIYEMHIHLECLPFQLMKSLRFTQHQGPQGNQLFQGTQEATLTCGEKL